MTSLQMIDPFFVGFENAFSRLNRTAKTSSFPPYNLIKKSENEYTIELALAGYDKDSINITLSAGTLEISSTVNKETEPAYLYKGISGKSFTRTFTVVDTIEVKDAVYKDGILTVNLVNKIPEQTLVKKIKID